MIYITGDTHGKFERIEQFCGKFKTSREDVLIILGTQELISLDG